MRVDRKVWGPGPRPNSRIVLARPGDEVSDAMWERILAAESAATATVTDADETGDSVAPSEPAAKKATRRRKKSSGS